MKKNKTILIVAPYGFNDRMSNFIEFITARILASNGWKVYALTRAENTDDKSGVLFDVNVIRYKSLLNGFFKGVRILFKNRPNIVHVHNLRNNRVGVLVSIISKLFGFKLLFTEYGLLHDHYLTDDRDDPLPKKIFTERVICNLKQLLKSWRGTASFSFKYYFSSYIFHWPLTHADRIVFVSKHNVEIAKRLGLNNSIYIPHIFDKARWVTKKTESKEKWQKVIDNLSGVKDEKTVLFIGQFKLRKGWDILLQAIPHIPPTTIPHFIVVTSSGDNELSEFTQMVDKLKIRSRILFLGKIFDSTLLEEVYKASSIVVVPSRYEGFGLVPIEAFGMNRPVIASNVEALTDYLVNGQNALLVEPKNPEQLASGIISLINDNNLTNKIISGGTETLEKLSSSEYHEKWLSFYDSILD